MKAYKTKLFMQWAKKRKVKDMALLNAANEMTDGLYDANLGGYVYKKRIALSGKGKSGSLRTFIAYKTNDNVFFMYGFSKNERANVSSKELEALKKLAKLYVNFSDNDITKAVKAKALFEVKP